MAVYHWTIYRPDLLPALVLFAVGLTEDLLTGAPVGVGALMLLIARAAVLQYRRYFVNRAFPFVWSGFTLLTGVAMLGLWALHCAIGLTLLDLRNTQLREHAFDFVVHARRVDRPGVQSFASRLIGERFAEAVFERDSLVAKPGRGELVLRAPSAH